jgi:hypothetical protein
LAAVNFFLFLANGYQVGRIVNYNMNQKNTTVAGEAKAAAKEIEGKAESTVEEAKQAVKSVTK